MPLPDFLVPSPSGVVIAALVQPRAARNQVVGTHGAEIRFKIAAPPVDDRANRAVEAFVADLVDVPKSRVSVVSGRSSRHKRIEVIGIDAEVVAEALDDRSRRG